MFVLLAGGIVRVTTARSRIRAARATICSGVSNITPAGAAPNVRSLGCAEWQARAAAVDHVPRVVERHALGTSAPAAVARRRRRRDAKEDERIATARRRDDRRRGARHASADR